jgi:hypothetical protein
MRELPLYLRFALSVMPAFLLYRVVPFLYHYRYGALPRTGRYRFKAWMFSWGTIALLYAAAGLMTLFLVLLWGGVRRTYCGNGQADSSPESFEG